jgi:hypothetical protein
MAGIANLIRRMSEAGASPEAIAIAVEAIEDAQGDIKARRAADAERKRRSRDSHRTVTGQSQPPATHLSLKEDIPPVRPLRGLTTPQGEKRKRSSTLPDDFQPDQQVALSEGFTPPEAQREAVIFADWARSSGAKKADWPATWRNWCRRKADERRQHSPPVRLAYSSGQQRSKTRDERTTDAIATYLASIDEGAA